MNGPFQVGTFPPSDELVEDVGVVWSRLVPGARS
jgi:hypothetical protein